MQTTDQNPRLLQDAKLCEASKVFSFEMLNKYLPPKIGFSDIDGVCELNGKFLFFEFKRLGARLPTGQFICYQRLLHALGKDAHLVLAEHLDLKTKRPAEIIKVVNCFTVMFACEGVLYRTPRIPAGEDELAQLTYRWQQWATKGDTSHPEWCARNADRKSLIVAFPGN